MECKIDVLKPRHGMYFVKTSDGTINVTTNLKEIDSYGTFKSISVDSNNDHMIHNDEVFPRRTFSHLKRATPAKCVAIFVTPVADSNKAKYCLKRTDDSYGPAEYVLENLKSGVTSDICDTGAEKFLKIGLENKGDTLYLSKIEFEWE